MMSIIRCYAMALFFGGLSALPVPLRQYPVQKDVLDIFHKVAAEKSKSYKQQAVDILSTADIRNELNKTCPRLVHLSSEKLLERIHAELAVSELMHTFSSNANQEGDTNLPTSVNSSYLYNIWQVDYLGLKRGPRLPRTTLNYVEEEVFHLPKFGNTTTPLGEDASPKTFEAASERVIYTALNHAKVSGPNNGFGDVTVIFKRSAVRDMTVVTPVDTGYWWYTCIRVHEKGPKYQDCSEWDGSVGTLQHLDHLIVYKYWMAHGNTSYATTRQIYPQLSCEAEYNHQIRIHGWPYQYPYFEADIVGNALFPHSVQAIAISFVTLFGSALGELAVQWCRQHRWVLFWAYDASKAGSDEHLTNNGRLLDPRAFADSPTSFNYSLAHNDTVKFTELLHAATSMRGPGKTPPTLTQLHEWWKELSLGSASLTPVPSGIYPQTTLAVQPLSAHQCAKPDNCVAVTQQHLTCICDKK